MKKLTILSYSFPPSNAPAAQRPFSIAKYLGKEGYVVNVLTCSNQDSSLGAGKADKNKHQFNLIKVPGISLKWFRKQKENKYKKGGEGRSQTNTFKIINLSNWIFPDKAVTWLPVALAWCIFHPKNFKGQVIFTSSPLATNHLLGLFIKRLFKPYWIADIRDFHYLTNYDQRSGNMKSKMHHWLEKKTIQKADKITFVTENMKTVYTEYYPLFAYKFFSIYNGFDPEDFNNYIELNETNFSKFPIRIFYSGSFYQGVRSPLPLILALQSLVDSKIINAENFEIDIAGNFDNELFIQISPYSICKQIRFLGQLPRNEVFSLMTNAHLLWLIVGDKLSHSATIPLKTFEYIKSGRPILYFGPDKAETAKVIQELNCGWILSNNPTENLSNAAILAKILSEKLFTKGFNEENSLRLNRYDRRNQAIEFGKLFNLENKFF